MNVRTLRRMSHYPWTLILVTLVFACVCSHAESSSTPVKVEVREVDGQWQLYRDGQPYYVRGAGLEFGDVASLAAHGGNSFRTWRTENGRQSCQEVLDEALRNGLTVAMGLEVSSERHGFDYNNTTAVSQQFHKIKAEVTQCKDHPALLMWVIGNELNLHASNSKVWDAVNDLSKMIHEEDPNHLTMTTLAGFNKDLADQIQSRAPDLDLIGIQLYSDIVNLPRYLQESGWTGPYMVTEWGATGHWEAPKTSWGAPIENNSSVKAELYRERFEAVIRSDQTQCLGSYVFLWAQKQERTPTWYGMFLESGEATESVDVMQFLWNDSWPPNRSPQVHSISLDSRTARQNIRLNPGDRYTAKILVEDVDGDPLTYQWELMEESRATSSGGDYEKKPRKLTGLVQTPAESETLITAPKKPGAYRLFAYVYDGQKHAAHANIPFYVEANTASAETSQP